MRSDKICNCPDSYGRTERLVRVVALGLSYVAFSSLLLFTSPANARESGDIVQEFASAIAKGIDPSTVPGVVELGSDQKAALAVLSGCKPSVAKTSTRQLVYLNYNCAEASAAEKTVNLEMHFSDGALETLWIDDGALIDAPGGGAAGPILTGKELTAGFLAAVKSSGDVTLGGRVPVTANQIARLRSLARCTGDKLGAKGEGEPSILFKCPARGQFGGTFVAFHGGMGAAIERISIETAIAVPVTTVR